MQPIYDRVIYCSPGETSFDLAMSSHKECNRSDQFFKGQGAAAADRPLNDAKKQALQLIEPGCVGGRSGVVRCDP